MENNWKECLSAYINRTISPDGRDTFESTETLSERIFEFASIKQGEKVLDLGCGWGKSLPPFIPHFSSALGIDMRRENIAQARDTYVDYSHVSFQCGYIQDLDLSPESVDLIISSLVLHQVEWIGQEGLFNAVKRVLKADGEMVMADEIILFNPDTSPERFNEVYRYLLEHTTPKEVYENHIKPYLQEGCIYTWQDMKKNTPPEYWFYSIEDLKAVLRKAELKIVDVQEITPFFGLLKIRHQ
ncbi:class I SAM-dependent methyltransferase [Phocaeicola oris]|uniref:class I SAM-dependent methyltransferase n=1 Tax=Phocaeicola oris TaxID=2896850 RepID=UPI00234EFD09|nr:class I SAM-dependent methyltransferase [Phocaeicola oris]MCE2615831.1 class I SAM-dependent methyltransferase [Phocaeicola oris]